MTIQYQPKIASPSSKWHVLAATWLGEMFDGMDASIFVLVLFPAVSELLNTTSHSTVGVYGSMILATFMMGMALGAILFGIAADYIGRTRAMVFTILLYAFATGLCALSHNWVEMALYRFLVGLGIGGEISIGGVMIAESWKGTLRLHATGLMKTSYPSGYLVAALLNLWLGHWGWRWLFVAGIIPALLTVYIRAKLKEPEHFELARAHKKRLRAKNVTELTDQEKEFLRFTLPQIFSKENRKKVLVVIALSSTMIIGYWTVISWIPPWINQLTGTLAIQERSFAAITMNIGSILAQTLAGSVVILLDRRNAFRVTFLASMLCCLSMFLTVKTFGMSLLVWAFLAGFITILPFALIFIYVPELFNTQILGTAFGFSVQIGRILAGVAALISGQLIALFGGSYAMAGACMAAIYLVGFTATFFMPKTDGNIKALSPPTTIL